MAQITVEYEVTPPQVWLSNLQRTVKDCRNFQVLLQFVEVPSIDFNTDQPGRSMWNMKILHHTYNNIMC